jgi:periplasmic protein TonB
MRGAIRPWLLGGLVLAMGLHAAVLMALGHGLVRPAWPVARAVPVSVRMVELAPAPALADAPPPAAAPHAGGRQVTPSERLPAQPKVATAVAAVATAPMPAPAATPTSTPISALTSAPTPMPAQPHAVPQPSPAGAVTDVARPAAARAEGPGGDAPPDTPPRFDAAYLHNPAPVYPLMSRRLQETGRVWLKVKVSPQGRALQVEVHQSSGVVRLDEAARQAVATWRFQPARQGGEAVEASVLVPITFDLGNP